MKKNPEDLFVIELDDQLLLLDEKHHKVEPLDDFDKVEEDVWVLSDLQSASPRFQWVETPPKYAEILVQRQLQEAGELEDGAQIITHWKQARGATATQIYFTAIQGKTYLTHGSRLRALEVHYLLVPSNALLFACLNHFAAEKGKKDQAERSKQKQRSKQKKNIQNIVAVLFEHGRHVDLLVGRVGQIIGAGRVSSFANTTEAKASFSTSVTAELSNIMESIPNDIDQIVYFNWLLPPPDSEKETFQADHTNWVDALGQQMQTQVKCLPVECYTMPDGTWLLASLSAALPYLSDSHSTATPIERMAYRTQQMMPLTVLSMLVVVLCLGTATLWLQMRNSLLQEEIFAMRNSSNSTQLVKVKPLNNSYQKVVNFIQNLDHWQRTPSYWMLLSELSSARANKLFFDRVTIQFDENVRALMTLTGAIESSFQTANKDHELFLAELTKRKFKVIKSNFATDVTQLTFEIELERLPE